MPTYEFVCKSCGNHFEVTCPMSERESAASCPKCSSMDVEQQFTAEFSSPRPPKY
jgi:putative FmdB family regulatory protein